MTLAPAHAFGVNPASMDLSIVVPIYNEEDSIPKLIDEIHQALSPESMTYEIICIDDGSSDASFRVLSELAAKDSRLRAATFRRNFGQTAAMQAGLDATTGRYVVMMDADLQNDPRDIPQLLSKLDEGYDLVAGWGAKRKDTFANRALPSIIAT